MVEFQLEDVFSSSFIFNMDRKPNVVEFFILGPSMARLALTRVARQRIVGSAITTTTPESRTDYYKETCTGTSEREGLSCYQVHLNLDFICSLAHFSDLLFFLAVSRPDSGNCQDTRRRVYRQHLTVHTLAHARCDHTFGGSRASRFVCVPQQSNHHWSCLC